MYKVGALSLTADARLSLIGVMKVGLAGALIGGVIGVLLAVLVHGVQRPDNCPSHPLPPGARGGSVLPCDRKSAIWPLLVGLTITGTALGGITGAAWADERSRRAR